MGDRRRAGLDLRRDGTSDRHRPPVPRPAGARHVGDLGAHRHLPAQWQRLRVLLPADHAHGRHRGRRSPSPCASAGRSSPGSRPTSARSARTSRMRPAVVQLFRRLTYLWAAVNAVAAAATLTLLLTRTGRCLRRHGDGLGVDHHLQRRRAHGVGVGPHGAHAKGSTLRYPPTGDCTPTFPLPTEVASQLVERGDVAFPSAAREDVMGRYPPSRRSANHERCHSRRAISHA